MKLHFVLSLVLLTAATIVLHAQPQRRFPSPEERTDQLQKALALTEEQTAAVLAIYKENDNERRAMFETFDGDREAMREAMRSLAETTNAKIEALLNDEQKITFAEWKKEMEERRMQNRRRVE